jgi:hypothetical protein
VQTRRTWQYLAIAIAVAAISATGTFAVTATGDDGTVRVESQQAQKTQKELTDLGDRIAALEAKQAASVEPDPQIMRLRTRVRQLKDCLTEVDSRVTSMNLEDADTAYPYLAIPQQLSRVCGQLLYPQTGH